VKPLDRYRWSELNTKRDCWDPVFKYIITTLGSVVVEIDVFIPQMICEFHILTQRNGVYLSMVSAFVAILSTACKYLELKTET
jgi:hypothetical protein